MAAACYAFPARVSLCSPRLCGVVGRVVPVARVSYGSYVASLCAAATLPAGAPYSARQCAAALQEPSEAAVRTLLRGKAPKSCGLESGPRALEHSVRAFRLHTHELRSVAQQGLHLAMQCNAMQCNAMPCHAMPCNAMQCNAMPCHAAMAQRHCRHSYCQSRAAKGRGNTAMP